MYRIGLPAARRMAAEGRPAAQAVAVSQRSGGGPRARFEDWERMQASALGMTAELWRLVRQPDVTDVVISGTDAWIDSGTGLQPVSLGLRSEAESRRLAIQMAAAAGRRLDDAQPIVDAVLPGPIRLHAVLPPLAAKGTSVSLRVLRAHPFTLDDLKARGMLNSVSVGPVVGAVQEGRSLLIAGATGAGKTTLLATLLGLVAQDQRIVMIEEVSELAVDHPHAVSLQARAPNIEGQGGIGLEDLVRAAVRMRPDRLVLGECRGPEVREVLTALNTGHQGGMATIHANSIEDVPARLLALGLLAGMDTMTVGPLASAAFQIVIFVKRAGGRRSVDALGHLELRDGQLRGVVDARAEMEG